MTESLQRIEQCARRHPRIAIALFANLEAIAKSQSHPRLQLDALYRRYFIKERLGEAPELLNALYMGLQLAENFSMPVQAGHMLEAIGRICYVQGGYRDAARYWTRCIDLCKFTNDTPTLVEARIGLGAIYDAMGDWETGARFHLDAGALLKHIDDPYLNSKQAINLAVNQHHIGQIESAKILFTRAKNEAERGGIAEYVAEARWHLGVLAMKQGELDQAQAEIKQALAQARACCYQWLQGAAMNTLAEISLQKNQSEVAIQIYLEALRHAKKVDSRTQQAHCHQALSRLYEKKDDARNALFYARQYQQITAELAELSVIDQFRELREYDLSCKPPAELLLDLSSSNQLEDIEFSDALQLIASSALNILRIELVCIWLCDEKSDQLVCRMLASPPELALRLAFQLGYVLDETSMPGYTRSLKRSHAALVAHDIRLHPAAAELNLLYGQNDLRSLLEVPLRMHGKHVGTISFGQCGKQRNWSREDILFGSHISNLVQQMLSRFEHEETQYELETHVARRTVELQQQTERLELAHRNIFLLSELGREITANLDRENVMACVYRHVHVLMKAEVFAIGLYKPELGIVDFPCNYLHEKRLLPYTRNIDEPDLLSVWCITHQKEIYINDITTEYDRYIGVAGLEKLTDDSAYPDPAQKIIPLSHIYVPLQAKNKTIGLIAIQSTKRNAFQRMHVDMLITLAAYTAVALNNADTYQQLSTAQQLLMSKEKLAALGSLVAGVAHELNTPLGNCLLTASTIQEQTGAFMQQLETGSVRRSELMQFTNAVVQANELLVRNLVSAGELVSSFKQVSVDQTSEQRRLFKLAETTHAIARTLQARIQKQGHSLHIEIPDEIEINSFPGPYGQVISNFIINALLHAFDGREQGKMELSAKNLSPDQVQIVFSDNGLGISAEHLRRIFDPFFTTKLGQGGSGLGLSIVHNIVTELLGGTIQVDR